MQFSCGQDDMLATWHLLIYSTWVALFKQFEALDHLAKVEWVGWFQSYADNWLADGCGRAGKIDTSVELRAKRASLQNMPLETFYAKDSASDDHVERFQRSPHEQV